MLIYSLTILYVCVSHPSHLPAPPPKPHLPLPSPYHSHMFFFVAHWVEPGLPMWEDCEAIHCHMSHLTWLHFWGQWHPFPQALRGVPWAPPPSMLLFMVSVLCRPTAAAMSSWVLWPFYAHKIVFPGPLPYHLVLRFFLLLPSSMVLPGVGDTAVPCKTERSPITCSQQLGQPWVFIKCCLLQREDFVYY